MAPAVEDRWEERFRAPTLTLPHWSRHAPERTVLTSDETGVFQAYGWDHRTGARRQATDERVGVIYASVSADGQEIVWFSDETGDESGRWLAAPFEGGDPRELLPGAPVGWPEGIALGLHRVVGILADRDGFAVYVSIDGSPAKEIHRDVDQLGIGGTDFHIEGFDLAGLSSDEGLLCISAAQDGDNIHRKLLVLDLETGAVAAELADGPGLGLDAFAWSPLTNDRRLVILHEREDLARPAIWDLETGERTDLAVDLPGEVIPVDWWPDGTAILVAHLFRGRSALHRLDLGAGTLTEILHPRGEVSGARVRPDGSVWLQVSSGHAAPRLLDDRGSALLEPDRAGLREGRPYREWLFRNADGDFVQGWLVVPEGAGPFPTYLHVHGGPSWLYEDTWQPEVQMLADAGFLVGMVNYRGSTGYGAKWRDVIIGNIGFPEVQDTVAGLDDLVARGLADRDRAVIGGRSWGGYTTLLALGTFPDRFAAGVAGVPVGDYMASYDDSAPSLQAYDRSLLGGVVHDLPDLVRERSPITYVEQVRAPVLVQVGENDTRCVPEQVDNYVNALRDAGGDVEVYRYGEGHSSYIVEEELRQWRAVLEFLRRRIALP